MKISIITACFNSSSTILDTVESIKQQDYDNIEHIIKDGNSTDSTLDLLTKHAPSFSKIVSQQDSGLYDALNQGIELATGDIIGFLHSDDIFYNQSVVSKIADIFINNDTDSLYGDLVYVRRDNTNIIRRYWKSRPYNNGLFLAGWMPPHPTFYLRREIYQKYGLFRTNTQSADYEIMLRFLHRYSISSHYMPEIIVKMRLGGISNKNIHNRLRANREDYAAWKLNGLKPKWYTRFLKPLHKVPQWFLSPSISEYRSK